MITIAVFVILFSDMSPADDVTEIERCLLKALGTAEDQATVGELKRDCSASIDKGSERTQTEVADEVQQIENSAITRRLKLEQQTRDNPFVITPHNRT